MSLAEELRELGLAQGLEDIEVAGVKMGFFLD